MIDVEVGDATLIVCPEENGEQDIILIDTGENDADRIRNLLASLGVALSNRPIDRFYVSHYDTDHLGDSVDILALVDTVYDHGDNNIKTYYKDAANSSSIDRRTISLSYQETFSGGVEVECLATNNKTDNDPNRQPTQAENKQFDGVDL